MSANDGNLGEAMLGRVLDGGMTSLALDEKEKRRVLIEEVGVHPELVEKLPEDRKTPPPPFSVTAP